METMAQAQCRIKAEFDEPVKKVVQGFVEMGYSRALIADALDVTLPSLCCFAKGHHIAFRHVPPVQRERTGRPPRRITHNGRTLGLSEWARELGVAPSTIHKRLRTRGSVA